MEFHETLLYIYDHGVVMHVKFHRGDISYRGVIAQFDCLHFKDFFSIPSHNLVSNCWNLMTLILSIQEPSVVIHMKLCKDIPSNRGVIAL